VTKIRTLDFMVGEVPRPGLFMAGGGLSAPGGLRARVCDLLWLEGVPHGVELAGRF
jgi:hypothetical protein